MLPVFDVVVVVVVAISDVVDDDDEKSGTFFRRLRIGLCNYFSIISFWFVLKKQFHSFVYFAAFLGAPCFASYSLKTKIHQSKKQTT